MANLTLAEFTEAVTALAEHHGVEQLRERLVRMNAFTSRRGLNSPAALAERLHLLTGGLRRQVPATYAFSSLWTDMIGSRLGEEGEKQLEELAERVNACLDGARRAKPRGLSSSAFAMDAVAVPHSQEQDLMRQQTARSVRAALSALPVKFRLPILLRYFEDLSYSEMATVMNCSMGTVASRLNRGHKMLAQMLESLR